MELVRGADEAGRGDSPHRSDWDKLTPNWGTPKVGLKAALKARSIPAPAKANYEASPEEWPGVLAAMVARLHTWEEDWGEDWSAAAECLDLDDLRVAIAHQELAPLSAMPTQQEVVEARVQLRTIQIQQRKRHIFSASL